MAEQVNGYRQLLAQQYDTYDHWREFCLTHGINVDFTFQNGFGNQCWDVPALLWFQYGLRFETGNGYAYGTWVYMRNANAKMPFIKVGEDSSPAMERKKLIKRGDCVVFAPTGLNYAGHVAFADEDYNGTDTLKCVGQNQGQGIGYGTPSIVASLSLRGFLGAFRNTNWKSDDPTPPSPSTSTKKEFPWVLYSRKFRTKRF